MCVECPPLGLGLPPKHPPHEPRQSPGGVFPSSRPWAFPGQRLIIHDRCCSDCTEEWDEVLGVQFFLPEGARVAEDSPLPVSS